MPETLRDVSVQASACGASGGFVDNLRPVVEALLRVPAGVRSRCGTVGATASRRSVCRLPAAVTRFGPILGGTLVAMTRVFEGPVYVSYSQAYVQVSGAEMPGMEEMFAAQVNGLCGAAVAGSLFLTTGLHTGQVPFTVEVFDDAPPLDDHWQDVVEVSFETDQPEALLLGWGGGSMDTIALGAPGSYRVRYCGHDMDAGRQQDARADGEPELDGYLLQFWPASPAADAVVRQGSEIAAYWHDYARTLPPPPTATERAAAQRHAAELAEAERLAAFAANERALWGGRAPSQRLRRLSGNVLGVAQTDRDLLDSFEALDAATQRQAARWLARRAFELAELDALDWVRPALEAMDQGEPLPAPFTDHAGVQALLRTGPTSTQAVARFTNQERERPRRIHRPSFAVPAVFSAVAEDPLQALVDTFSHAAATFNDDRDTLIDELRARFLVAAP